MRISRYRKFKRPEAQQTRFKVNEQIKAPEVRLIDENGTHVGVVPFEKAIELAVDRGFDIVEIDPSAAPPIVKLLEYGQFKYEKEKEARRQKAHAKEVEVKGIRLSARIGAHDLEVRRKQSKGFLEDGDKVQVEVVLRGREKQHADLAAGIMHQFIESIKKEIPVKIEQPLTRQGGKLSILIARI